MPQDPTPVPIIGADSKHTFVKPTSEIETYKSYRPSYSPDNAMKWKPFFDAMIKSKTNREATTEATGYKDSTLFLQAQDALKWLCDHHSNLEERANYLWLRNAVRIRRVKDKGIVATFKLGTDLGVVGSSAPLGGEVSWRDKFQQWLSTAQPGQIWDSQVELQGMVVAFTPADKEWLTKLLAEIEGTEMDMAPEQLRVMR